MIETKREIGADMARALPEGWRWVRLGDVCELNPRRPTIARADDAPTTFIPMSGVGEGGSGIIRAESRPYNEVRSGYTYFGEGDVLFAKITPCMQNGKHAVARKLRDGLGFGSTEFHVIRPTEFILPEWAHQFLMQPNVLTAATAHFTGAVGQQRVPASFLADLEVPLPPLPEQRRIAAELRERMAGVERARAAAEAQLAAARGLAGALLRAVFESDEARGWQQRPLGELAMLGPDNGVFKRRVDFGRGVPIVNVSDLYRDLRVDLSTTELVQVSPAELKRYAIAAGDLFFCRSSLKREGVGWCCYAADVSLPAVFDCHVMRVRVDPSQADPGYIAHYWRLPAVRERVISGSKTATMTTMNQVDLARICVPMPPIAEQRRIAAMLDVHFAKVKMIVNGLNARLDAINQLPGALLRQAFSGEL